MSNALYYALCALLTVGVLVGIALMSRVRHAAKGNLLSGLSMVAAILITLYRYELLTDAGLWIAMALGTAIGVYATYRVKMIQMPQAVALLNGLGGAASAIVGCMELISPAAKTAFATTTAALAVVVGMLTLTGSLIAAGKLHGLMGQRPVKWPAHSALTIAGLIISLVAVICIPIGIAPGAMLLLGILSSGFFGVAFAIRVGGADMPITISLLNSFSGVAAGIAGLAIADPLLVAVGGIVGASGLLLTQIMCGAMNRHLLDILLGKTSALQKEGPKPHAPDQTEEISMAEGTEAAPEEAPAAADVAAILKGAKRAIIVPGYGMALAQAQAQVKTLADKLSGLGAQVDFAIHPVAGRMPGHMNVLLAEVDVSYEQLREMDDINPEFATCDVCIVVGANDVVNPAANTAEGTPIYGMPVLNVENASHLILCNYDTKPGYAGVDNPLYQARANVTLMLGDAKDSLNTLLGML